jgi:hypothetical protein
MLLLTAIETIGLVRDLVLIAMLLFLILVFSMGMILSFLFYRRVTATLRKLERTLDRIESVSRQISKDIVGPITTAKKTVFGIRPLISMLLRTGDDRPK